MTDAVFISDVEGNFIDFNDAFATYHRFKNKENTNTDLQRFSQIILMFILTMGH